jgi:hypothetical protein
MTACGKLVTGYNSPDRDNPQSEHWVELRTGYPCSVELETSGAHPGPCAAVEQPQTVTSRQRWLETNRRRTEDLRHQSSGLGETQGRPLTFAENAGADPAIIHPAQEVPCPLCSDYVLAKDLPDHLRQVHASTAATAVRTVPPKAERGPAPPGYYYAGDGSAEDTGEMHSSPSGPRGQMPTRADRPHDQALPEPNTRPVMHEVLIDLVSKRLAIGVERYGTGLQPMNGRDAFRDLVEELVDATVYTLQIQHEKAEMLEYAKAIHYLILHRVTPEEPAVLDVLINHIETLLRWLGDPVEHSANRRA